MARRLPVVTRLRLRAGSGPGSRCGWNGCGEGEVRVERLADGSLVFHESGRFHPEAGPGARRPALRFDNSLRWCLRPDRIALTHRRFGAGSDVGLVELRPDAGIQAHGAHRVRLASPVPHRCGADDYHARVDLTGELLELTWRILGPGKNETLRIRYE